MELNMKIRKNILLLGVIFLNLSISVFGQEDINLTLLHTSDVHSRIEPINQRGDSYFDQGGFVRRSAFLKEFRENHKEVLLFDCGDVSQGTPYYNMFRGEVEIKLMNEMGYHAMTIGNHEFDFGLDNMARLFKMATFPIVCSNYDLQSTVLKDLVKPYIIIEKYGLRIGVFGLAPKPEGLIQAQKCIGVVYHNPVKVANQTARILKKKGCDLIICLSHLGIQYDEYLVGKTAGIDVILGGHSHTFMKIPKTYLNMEGRKVFLLHSGKSGIYVGQMDLKFKKK